MKALKARIRKWIGKIFVLLRKVRLPGFQGMNLLDVLKFFFNGLMDSKFTLMASAMSYQFFFSLFPSLILMFIILRNFPFFDLDIHVVDFIQQFVPDQGQDWLVFGEKISEKFFDDKSSIWLVIVSVLLALWGATRGIIAMMKAFTKNEEVFKKRSIFELYGTALFIFFILGVLIILSVSVLIAGGKSIEFMQSMGWIWGGFGTFLLQTLRYFITLLTLFLAISTLFYLAPAAQQRWTFISPGGVIAGLLFLIAMIGLDYFFRNFTNFDKIYGSLGAIILLMVWFYYISIILLIGFELNAAIDMASYHSEKENHKAEDVLAEIQALPAEELTLP